MPKWKQEIFNNTKEFKKFYSFCFKYNITESYQKRYHGNSIFWQYSLPLEIALPTWKLVLKEKCKYIDEWCSFMESDFKKAVTLDTWNVFLEFINQVTDFAQYDSDSAWPSAIDGMFLFLHNIHFVVDFVEYYKKHKK